MSKETNMVELYKMLGNKIPYTIITNRKHDPKLPTAGN